MYSRYFQFYTAVVLLICINMQSCEKENMTTITFERKHERLEEKQLARISQLTSLLYLKCTNEDLRFSISSKIDSNESLVPFDDLIFVQHIGEKETPNCRLIWSPPGLENYVIKENDFISTDQPFSIEKIYEHYLKIKQFFKLDSTKFMISTFDNCKLVLFTHARIENGNTFGLKYAVETNDDVLNINGKVSVFKKTSSVIQQCISNVDDIDGFIERFYIFHDQAYGENLSNQLSNSFGDMKVTSESLTRKLVLALLQKTEEWLVKENDVPFLSEKSEYLKDIFKEQITIVNLPMEAEVDKIRVKALAEYVDQLRNDISGHRAWIVYSGSGNNKPHLTTLYLVHHVLRFLDPYLFVTIQDLISSHYDILDLWRSKFCTYLVIVMDPEVSPEKVSEVSISIIDTLNNYNNKKVTFISSEGDHYKELNNVLNNVAINLKQ